MMSGIQFGYIDVDDQHDLMFLKFCENLTELCTFSDSGILAIREVVNKIHVSG